MSMLPQITIPEITRNVPIPIGDRKMPLWDFDTGEFMKSENGRITVTIDSTLKASQLSRFALLTQRGMSPLFNWEYGSDLLSLIGKHPQYIETRIIKMVHEALHMPQIISEVISSFSIEDESLFLDIEILVFNDKSSNISLVVGT